MVLLILGVFIVSSIDIESVATPDEATADTAIEITIQPTTVPATTVLVTEPESTTGVEMTECVANATEDLVCYSSATNDHAYEVSEYELDLVARTIYQEAGICGEYCQWLIGSTILNLADEYGGIENIVFDYNKFNVAYVLYNSTPSDLSYSVARRVLAGDRDYNVKAFRTNYYHSFGTPYTNVDNVYFSTY